MPVTESPESAQHQRGRPTKITYELVERIASDLVAKKGQFTCADVLTEIGEGSMTTVHPLVKMWRERNPPAHGKAIESSPKFQAALSAEIHRQVDAILQSYEIDLSVARTDNDHLCNALERLQGRLEEIELAAHEMKTALAESNAALHALREERTELKAEIKRLETTAWLNREQVLLAESKLQNIERLQNELRAANTARDQALEQAIQLRSELAASTATMDQLKERLLELRQTRVAGANSSSNTVDANPIRSASATPKRVGPLSAVETRTEDIRNPLEQSSQSADAGNHDAARSVNKAEEVTQQPSIRGKRSKPTQKDWILSVTEKMLESSPIVTSPKILARLTELGFQVGGEEPIGIIAATLSKSKKFRNSKSPRGWMLENKASDEVTTHA